MTSLTIVLVVALIAAPATAQNGVGESGKGTTEAAAPEKSPRVSSVADKLITEVRVKQVVEFLASDAMCGRDTPSPGLDRAALYIVDAFRKAGLQPVAGDAKDPASWFHIYERPGLVVDSAGVKLVLHMQDGREGVELRPGADVRVYGGAGPSAFDREDTDLIIVEEAKVAQRLNRSFPRSPVVILVDPKESALWNATQGERKVMSRGRRLSRAPMLLVRAGAMPKGDLDHAEVRVAASKQVTLQLKNVVGVLPGKAKKKEYVLFSAHYDHIGAGLPSNGDSIYNGADDNASGTTGVITLAEAFAKAPQVNDRSLMFVCFSGEEKGLLGSRAFAEEPPIPLQDIAVNINLEMLGRPDQIKPKAAWVTGREYSDFEEIVKIGFARAGIECVEFRQARMLFNASDNASFARKGVVAHSISAGSLHDDYHRATDHVDKLDLPHMTAVIRGLFEVGLEFANRPERPRYNEQGRRVLRLDR